MAFPNNVVADRERLGRRGEFGLLARRTAPRSTFILVQTAKVKEQRWSEAAAQAQQQVASLLRELESARTAATEANGRAAAVKDELTRANVAGAPTSAAQPQPAASTGAQSRPSFRGAR